MSTEKKLNQLVQVEAEESDDESDMGSISSFDSQDAFLNPDFASILGQQQRIAAPKTPTALFGLTVPAGGEPVPMIDEDEVPQAVRITMAAIDIADESSSKACQVKVIRRPIFEEDSEDEDDASLDEEEIAMYTEEYTLCTLKPGVIYQQTLDLTFSEGEMIFFAVTGDCDVHLTGNYMTPIDEAPEGYDSEDDMEDDDFDSEDDSEDEDVSESDLARLEALEDEEESDDEEEDVLDEIDARISALEEAEAEAASSKKSKKRRVSAGADEDLDAVMDEAEAEEPKKLSKKDRKKLKAANGEAVAAPTTPAAASSDDTEDSAKKSVSFSNDTKPAAKLLQGGLQIEDRKQGEGASVKNGSKVAIRYVGKLKSNGKQFDANAKGKPFTFTVGKGEVIKGMELGVVGMKAGGERRVTIPAAMAYGKKSLPSIPANSDLIFDIRCLRL